MKLWKEVSPFTGMEEDAPVNSVAGGGVAMPPDALYSKKKKKEIQTREGTKIDGRTKSYREHRKKLEQTRIKRQENKGSSKFIENIKKKAAEMSYGAGYDTAIPMAAMNPNPKATKKKKKNDA